MEKANLPKLKKSMPFKWRVQSFSKNKPSAACVAYIDSRDAQDLLDTVCGASDWQCEYYEVKGILCCKIGIKVDEEWVWKADGGSESAIEGEKGALSDAFKRAAVKWGVGRFLYDLKIQYISANEIKNTSNYPYVVDNSGKRVWDITTYINQKL